MINPEKNNNKHVSVVFLVAKKEAFVERVFCRK